MKTDETTLDDLIDANEHGSASPSIQRGGQPFGRA